MATKRKDLNKKITQEAVDLLNQGRKSPAYIAGQPGITVDTLYQWQEQINEQKCH